MLEKIEGGNKKETKLWFNLHGCQHAEFEDLSVGVTAKDKNYARFSQSRSPHKQEAVKYAGNLYHERCLYFTSSSIRSGLH